MGVPSLGVYFLGVAFFVLTKIDADSVCLKVRSATWLKELRQKKPDIKRNQNTLICKGGLLRYDLPCYVDLFADLCANTLCIFLA